MATTPSTAGKVRRHCQSTSLNHRGRRTGQQLIEAVCVAARQTASSRVYLQTQVTHAAGRALYGKVARRAGFIVYTHELQCLRGKRVEARHLAQAEHQRFGLAPRTVLWSASREQAGGAGLAHTLVVVRPTPPHQTQV